MARVFVTGGTGFIGFHLVRALSEAGHTVSCLVRPTSRIQPLKRFGPEFVEANLFDVDSLHRAVEGCDVVFHLAGTTKALKRETYFRVNGDGARAVAEACARCSEPPRLIALSSLAAAGPATPDRPRTEDQPAQPISVYGKSKRAGEIELEKFADRVPTTILRPAIVFGPWDKDCLQMFQPIYNTGVHMVPGFKPRYYSLVYVADLIPAILAAVDKGEHLPADPESEPGRGYYFIAGDECPSYAELGRMMGRALGRKRTLIIPAGVVGTWIAAAGAELIAQLRGRPMALHLDKAREALAPSWVCSAEKAKRDLGFSPQASLDERLRQTAEWYRERRWLRGKIANREGWARDSFVRRRGTTGVSASAR